MRFEQRPWPAGLVLNRRRLSKRERARVLDDQLIQKYRKPIKVLAKTPCISTGDQRLSRFRLLYPHQLPQFVGQAQFCYQDDLRDYFVTPDVNARLFEKDRTLLFGTAGRRRGDPYFLFEPLCHPYACTFVKTLRRGGMDALLSPEVQRLSDAPGLMLLPGGGTKSTVTKFETIYAPTPSVLQPYPMEDVDFTLNGSYASYNWELFFHAVLLVADSLSGNQRFDEARQWFHFIFDPMTTGGGPSRRAIGISCHSRMWRATAWWT